MMTPSVHTIVHDKVAINKFPDTFQISSLPLRRDQLRKSLQLRLLLAESHLASPKVEGSSSHVEDLDSLVRDLLVRGNHLRKET